jgi:SPP1 gp7 family putative phage head morphogenesis protein
MAAVKPHIKLLLQQRKAKTKKGRRRPLKWLFPTAQERKYYALLRSLVKELNEKIRLVMYPEIPSMVNEVEGNVVSDRADDFLDRLSGLIFFIRRSMQNKIESTIKGADEIAISIARFNRAQLAKINENVFGIDLFTDEPFLADQLKIFSAQNSQLIRSLVDHELKQVREIVEVGLQQGERFEGIAKDIAKTFGVDQRRARTIARDQTSKLNASLTRLRQMEIGVEEYIWETSNDERVRATHKANQGKKFRWDTPPPITGHPSHDINCRCVASPVLDKLLE